MANYLAILCVVIMTLQIVCGGSVEEARAKLIHLKGSGSQRAAGDYYFGQEWSTFSQAQTNCQEAGLSLLAVSNKLEQNVINSYLYDGSDLNGWSGYAWIAGTDRGQVGSFYWQPRSASSPQPMQYFNWQYSGSNGCVAMNNYAASTGKWNVQPCTTKLMYFCEA